MLIDYTLRDYIEKAKDTSSEPGGGSVAALCGALSGSLLTMVYNFSKNKEVAELNLEKKEEIERLINSIQLKIAELGDIIDQDSKAFNSVLIAMKLPKTTEEEKAIRNMELEKGYLKSISVPKRCIELSLDILRACKEFLPYGNVYAITDMGMAAMLAYTAIEGSRFNIEINLSGIKDEKKAEKIIEEVKDHILEGKVLQNEIVESVYSKIR